MKLIWSCFALAVRAFAVAKGPAGDIYGETMRERDRDRGLMGRRTRRHWWRLLAPEMALSVWGAVLGCGGGATGHFREGERRRQSHLRRHDRGRSVLLGRQ